MIGHPLAPSLEEACRRWAGREAVVSGADRVSYGRLWEMTGLLAAHYSGLGIQEGDRIVCQVPNSIDLLVCAGAAWRCGAVHVGADRDLTGPELARLVDRTDAAVVVYRHPPESPEPGAVPQLAHHGGGRVHTILAGDDALAGADANLGEILAAAPGRQRPPVPGSPAGPGRVDLLLATSGTTATPKLVEESLPSLWAKMQFFADAFGPVPGDVHLLALPLAHAFGLKLALTALASGGRLVLMSRFSPEEALRLVGDEQATILPGTPTHCTLLLDRLDAQRHRTSSLRWAITAAAPFPRRVAEQVYRRLGVELMYVYGCTEGFLTITTDREEILAGSVGRTVFRGPHGSGPDGSVAVVDVETSLPVAAGEIGQIVYGATRPVAYWGEPAGASDGWYRTGDLGRLDPYGRLYVTGRLKDVVNRGGLKVSCGEVEAALMRHPAVVECAVVPVADPVLGEAVCACIVATAGASLDLAGIRSFLGPGLARHKLPDEVRLLPALPRSKVGKLDRPALARMVAAVDGERMTA